MSEDCTEEASYINSAFKLHKVETGWVATWHGVPSAQLFPLDDGCFDVVPALHYHAPHWRRVCLNERAAMFYALCLCEDGDAITPAGAWQ